MSDLSGLNPTPHAIAVYASQPLSPGVTQHSLPSGRCPYSDRSSTGGVAPAFLAHSFDDLVGAGARISVSELCGPLCLDPLHLFQRQMSARHLQVVMGLKVHPELWRVSEIQTQPQRRVGRNTPSVVAD